MLFSSCDRLLSREILHPDYFFPIDDIRLILFRLTNIIFSSRYRDSYCHKFEGKALVGEIVSGFDSEFDHILQELVIQYSFDFEAIALHLSKSF